VVDQVRTWVGEVASVSAALPIVSARDGGAEDSFVVRVTTRSGAHGVLQQTAASWSPQVVGVSIVAGTEGTIEVTDVGVFCSDRSGRHALPVPPDLARSVPSTQSDDPRERYTHLELGPYTQLVEVLRAGVEQRPHDSAVVPPTFVDGLAEMRVLDAVRASALAGGALIALNG
jgi:predicted dehydrogenase